MMRSKWKHLIAAGVLVTAGIAGAAELYVYPRTGQSEAQQEQDEFACSKWAKETSGFDPMAAPAAAQGSVPSAPQGGALRGAAKGAALGAIGGAIAGDAGKGAAMGAGVGGAVGVMRRAEGRRREAMQLAQEEQEKQVAQQEGLAEFNRAYSACLEGRGYTVK